MGHGGGALGGNTMPQIFCREMGYSVIVLSNFDPPVAEEIAAKSA
jgi:hypothetical protein